VKYRIIGEAVQTVVVELPTGEAVFGRMGTLLFAKGAITNETGETNPYWTNLIDTLSTLDDAPLVIYRCDKGGGIVGFRAPGPGKIHPVTLDPNKRVVVRRSAIVAATEGLQCDRLHLEGEDAGDVPSKMFVTIFGSGYLFLHGPGNLVDFTLGQNERMVVDGEMILEIDAGMDMATRPVGKPGQSGQVPYVLLMHITGPGRIILHTMRHGI
jgi:uncharacterized protein (AIM24 family)